MSVDKHFCPMCGIEHDAAGAAIAEDAIDMAAEVQIAQINADRDIALAKIGARVAESDLVVETVALAAENDALSGTVDTLTEIVAPEPAADAAPSVVVIDSPDETPGEPDGPPEVRDGHPGGIGDEKPRSTGYGNPLFFS
jgi:hypothetical protein